LGVLGTLDRGTVTIQTADGDDISVSDLIADTPVARSTGFRGFPEELINGFPGILFVNDEEVDNPYTMVTVPFDLDVAFYNGKGEWVGGTTMTAQSKDLYNAGGTYQYALELPAGSLKDLGIGAGSKLVLP
jgi:uncharacterized membrane protein (UPF0127 family)